MSSLLCGRLITRWRHGISWCHRCGKGPCFYSTRAPVYIMQTGVEKLTRVPLFCLSNCLVVWVPHTQRRQKNTCAEAEQKRHTENFIHRHTLFPIGCYCTYLVSLFQHIHPWHIFAQRTSVTFRSFTHCVGLSKSATISSFSNCLAFFNVSTRVWRFSIRLFTGCTSSDISMGMNGIYEVYQSA